MYNKNLPTYAEPSPVSPQRRENALDSSVGGVDVQTLINLAIERVLLSAWGQMIENLLEPMYCS
jgi:hypothetical protein